MRHAFLVVLLAACSEFGLGTVGDDAPERVRVTDRFRQEPLPAVDLLFVVDHTPSMAQELDALSDGFVSLASTLTAEGLRWQVGVVLADTTGPQAGWLRGAPWVLSPETDDVLDAFARAVPSSADGVPPETGIAAAVEALSLAGPGGPNAGFRRPDAVLEVVFVSDGDDRSDDVLGPDAVDTLVDVLDAEAAWTGLPARASAIVGDVPSGCVSDRGDARPGFRYHRAVEARGGRVQSICRADFDALLSEIGEGSVAWRDTFPLRTVPLADTVRVSVDGERVDGWSLRLQGPEVVFDAPPPPNAAVEVTYLVEVDG